MNELKHKKKQIVDLLWRYNQSAINYLILEQKINHFFTNDIDGVIGYEVCDGIAFIIGEPVVEACNLEKLIVSFMDYCSKKKLKICFCSISDKNYEIYNRLGFKYQKYGLEAILSSEQFTLQGSSFAKVRWGVNKLTRLGYKVKEYAPRKAKDEVLEKMILSFSDGWQNKQKKIRLKFMLGDFNFHSDDDRRYFCLLDLFDSPQAIITCMPYKKGKGYFVDIMRYHPNAPLGAMEKLIYDAFNLLQVEGVTDLSLGLAPLAGMKDVVTEHDGKIDLIFDWIFTHSSNIYRFKSLYQFKKKFNPIWEKRYLAYYPPKLSLKFLVALARLKVDENIFVFILKSFNGPRNPLISKINKIKFKPTE